MSADLAYRLLVSMETKGNMGGDLEKVGAKAKGVDGALKQLGSSAMTIGQTFAGAFVSAAEAAAGVAFSLAKIGVVGAGAAISYGVAGLNNELEKTQISLAAIFNAQGLAPNMTVGMRAASDVMETMRVHARDLPGELKDLQQFFKLGITPGLGLGGSVGQIEKLSAQGMAAAAATGVQMDQAAREFAQLLQGRAGAHNVFGSMLGFTGEDASKLNAATGDTRLKMIETALGKYQGSIETFGGSFDALSSTLIDNSKKFLGTMTAGLFERVKIAMSDANSWFDSHQTSMLMFAEKIGEKLNYAFDVGRRKIEEWWPSLMAFAASAEDKISSIWERVGPIIEALGPKLQKALADPALFDHLESGAKLYAGAKLGTMAAPAVSSAVGGVGEALGLGGLGSLSVVLAPLAAVALMAAGAFESLTNAGSYFHETATQMWNATQEHLGEGMKNLGRIAETVGPPLMKVAELLGQQLLLGLDLLALAFAKVTGAIATVFETIETGLLKIGVLKLSDKYAPGAVERDGEYNPMFRAVTDGFVEGASMAMKKTKTGAGGGGGGTNIQKVEIVVASNQDPSRIARLTADILTDKRRFPTSSPGMRNFSAARP